jgi:CheY-like chemotaxis protein
VRVRIPGIRAFRPARGETGRRCATGDRATLRAAARALLGAALRAGDAPRAAAIDRRELLASWRALPPTRLGIALSLTALSHAALTGYDLLAFRFLSQPLDRPAATTRRSPGASWAGIRPAGPASPLARASAAARLVRGRPPFDRVISDHRMPGFTGLGVLRGLQSFRSAPPFIVITAFGGSEFAAEAERAAARAVLDKPFDSRGSCSG